MVATVDFSSRMADNMAWRDVSELTELVPNQRYQLPEPCVEASFVAFLNGQALDRVSTNGFMVLSPTVFELKEPKRTDHVLFVMYLRQ